MNPTPSPERPEPEYVRLSIGSLVRQGDEFFDTVTRTWMPTEYVEGDRRTISEADAAYRRRVATRTPAPEAVAGERGFIVCEGRTEEAPWLRQNIQDALEELEKVRTERLAAAGLSVEASSISSARVILDSALALHSATPPQDAEVARLKEENTALAKSRDDFKRYADTLNSQSIRADEENRAALLAANQRIEKLLAKTNKRLHGPIEYDYGKYHSCGCDKCNLLRSIITDIEALAPEVGPKGDK